MNIRELLTLLEWVDEYVKQSDIVEHYQMVQEILERHAQPNQSRQPFLLEKVGLIKALEGIPLDELIDEQIVYLEKLGILPNIGDSAISAVKEILTDNALDPATAADKIGSMVATLSDGLEKSESLRANLDGLAQPREKMEKEAILRVKFEGDSTITNIVNFRLWANNWYDIGYGIARFNNIAPENIRVIGADHEPLIVELAMNHNYALQILNILYGSLKSIEKIYNLRFYQDYIGRQHVKQVTTVMIKEQLEEEINSEKEEYIERIFRRITKEVSIPSGEGDRAIHLRKCIRNLMDFIDKGGKVDFILPDLNKTENYGRFDPKMQKLITKIENYRRFEREVKALVMNVDGMYDGRRPWLSN